MTMLHGEKIKVGDAVFDVSATRGPGIVSMITPKGIEVKFASGPMIIYQSDGKQRGRSRATLFWHDPIAMFPVKDPRAWDAQKRVGLAVRDAIKEAMG